MSPDARLDELCTWLARLGNDHRLRIDSIRPASNDASFRRYFRIDREREGSVVAMDAPPPAEDCRPFIRAAEIFGSAGVRVPRILAADPGHGFLLLEDFGATTYLERLATDGGRDADRLYRDASAALVRIQAAGRPGSFPPYDRALLERELALFPEWYVARHRGIALDDQEQRRLHEGFERLVDAILGQPVVHVHRDYHSRNLMVLEHDGPGILDFQDAVEGPITYDAVSLFRDAYVDWPEDREIDWVVRYWEAARAAGLPVAPDFGGFYRDYEWMGVQRQLKVLGIFARLSHRDGKHRYLDDMPRVLGYLRRTVARYGALAGLARLIDRIEADEPRVGYTF
ncbi:MAG: phosphotransferase [Pseudomonadota bacterium]|nr:phosphotransferase [Pseudomonadota bacterium]